MRSVATDGIVWSVSVCVCVCLSVGHVRELCKNGWTDRVAVWMHGWIGPRWGPDPTRARGNLRGLFGPFKSIVSQCYIRFVWRWLDTAYTVASARQYSMGNERYDRSKISTRVVGARPSDSTVGTAECGTLWAVRSIIPSRDNNCVLLSWRVRLSVWLIGSCTHFRGAGSIDTDPPQSRRRRSRSTTSRHQQTPAVDW